MWSERRDMFAQTENESQTSSQGDLSNISPIISYDYRCVDYIMELHKELERLKTEKLMLLRYAFQKHTQKSIELFIQK